MTLLLRLEEINLRKSIKKLVSSFNHATCIVYLFFISTWNSICKIKAIALRLLTFALNFISTTALETGIGGIY